MKHEDVHTAVNTLCQLLRELSDQQGAHVAKAACYMVAGHTILSEASSPTVWASDEKDKIDKALKPILEKHGTKVCAHLLYAWARAKMEQSDVAGVS